MSATQEVGRQQAKKPFYLVRTEPLGGVLCSTMKQRDALKDALAQFGETVVVETLYLSDLPFRALVVALFNGDTASVFEPDFGEEGL